MLRNCISLFNHNTKVIDCLLWLAHYFFFTKSHTYSTFHKLLFFKIRSLLYSPVPNVYLLSSFHTQCTALFSYLFSLLHVFSLATVLVPINILYLDLSLSQLPPSLSAPKIASSAVQGVKSALLVVVSRLPISKIIYRKSCSCDKVSRAAIKF